MQYGSVIVLVYGAPTGFLGQAYHVTTLPQAFDIVAPHYPSWNMDTGASSHLANNTCIPTTLSHQSIGHIHQLDVKNAFLHGHLSEMVCLCMHDPWEPHLTALKRILRYVRGNIDHDLQLHVTLSCFSAEAEYRCVVNVVDETAWIGDEFLKILRDNTFNGVDKGDVTDHMAKILEISEWIKIPNVDHNQIRLHIFPISLSEHAKEWWDNEIKDTATTWNELSEKFFLKYYPVSHTWNSKIPDDLDNGTDYLEFLDWLGSKFKNHWNMDRNTKNRLWDFYNECDKSFNKYQKNSCSDSFFKPYLDAQEGNGIYNFKESNQYSPQIP
ncbi:reverse transcriptase domain-containing protein, partial [Tanacetum coccineum]